MAFEEDIGTALAKACEFDSDNEAIHPARAARIIRSHIFGKAKPFTSRLRKRICANHSACPSEHDPSIQDQSEATTPAALSITQLLKFNSIKHKRKQATTQSVAVRHSTAQETPLPTYIGLMLHA